MPKATGAITLLKKDHQTVRELLTELAESTSRGVKKRASLLARIGVELRVHAQIEEEIFYPAIRKAAKTEDDRRLVPEAVEEHRAVEDLVLPHLERTAPGTVEFGGRAKVLKEMVEHHAKEEEKEMFPAARRLLTKEKLEDLGRRLEERKKELLQELKGERESVA